jgi:cAMP-dependent protein kinase regulator
VLIFFFSFLFFAPPCIKNSTNRYIVDSGKFDIFKNGQGKIAECGKGGRFGELALLYDAARAATVTCVEQGKLWRLDRKSFR